ncbi:adenosylcobinamide-phosphate synthase CbiB [Frigidibacter sp. ROC022]|uniref:adenosylcobinamide-phosphate synthase CbiB n=1 Tax=Frigidibacter sp. ROC022 TaxID=2971796 RepID=UPI0023DE73D5|nr:adenosylcobinamide-phosphate synthase CbiB [Frigidibacter sp. ROC022]
MLLAAALLLDAVFGEPRWLWSRLPHPAVLAGRIIDLADRRFNRGGGRRAKGAAVVAVLVVGAAALGLGIRQLPLAPLWQVLIAAILLAQRSLCDHVANVAAALRLSTGEGRRAVARIVGRDTSALDDPAIARAAIESAAENLSDGVIAPAFWFLVAGLPGILVYKLINTADSMIGHRTARHEAFGWAAARLDDLLNLIPARLTALLLWLARPVAGAWTVIRRDAPLHRSPNAGWPEAAMAVALDVALSGPRSYGGRMRDFPHVHPEGARDPGPETIDRAVSLLWRAWALMLGLVLLLALATRLC